MAFVHQAQPLLLLHDVPEPYRRAFDPAARRLGLEIAVTEGEPAAAALADRLALVVLRLDRADTDALERLGALRKGAGDAPVVALVPNELGVEAAVVLLRSGAHDVVGLPSCASEVAARVLGHVRRARSEGRDDELVGRSAALARVRHEIDAVAPMESTVLLLGETGTGKGLAARRIHRLSRRAAAPFVHVDCAALSPSVIESELFGHERGAFTGAAGRRAGRFELAGDGTIFLDEIGDLEPRLQSKLLRVLQDREYERLGGTQTLVMSARVIAATSRDLRHAVEQGQFRADLYFRLNVFRIRMPPLRERRGDVSLLLRAAIEASSQRLGLAVPVVRDDLHAACEGYDWPGNVRELWNVVERMLVRARSHTLTAQDLASAMDDAPAFVARGGGPDAAVPPLDDARSGRPREEIASALRASGGNVARAARRLGLPRSTLRYWIQQHGLAELVPRD